MPLTDRYVPLPVKGDVGDMIANQLAPNGHDLDRNWLHFRRPYLADRGRNVGHPCITVNTGQWTVEKGERVPLRRQERIADLLMGRRADGSRVKLPFGHALPPIFTLNATSLRKEDWIQLDTKVQLAYRQRLRLVSDLMSKVPRGGFNAMGKMTFEYEAMSDPGVAVVDMDALTDGTSDSPLFKLRSLPLPITHSDFWYSERLLSVSRNSQGLDQISAEAAGRRVAEKIEKTTIGVDTGVTYGTQSAGYGTHDLASTVFGLTNYTNRNTKTNFTTPTSSNGPTSYNEVLAALETLRGDNVFGPFTIYHSTDWSTYMDTPFSTAGGNHPGETLRTMLLKNPDIADVVRLDFLTSTFTMIFVQVTSDVVEFINGMDVTTVQWETQGGMRKNFKVMAIQVPLLRSDYSGKCGILHGTTA